MKIKLTTKSVDALQQSIKTARLLGDLHMLQRCSALLLLSQGHFLYEVARAFAVCDKTISRWVALYLSRGIKALKPKKAKGRPSRLTKTQKQQLLEDIERGPEKCGYTTGVWSSALIQDHIKQTFGVSYSSKYISQLLHTMGCSYVKPNFHYAQEPEDFASQLKWIRETCPALLARVKAEGGVLLFQDESTFQLQTNTAKTWHIKGKNQLIERNPKRKNVKVYGAIDLFSGELTYSICEGRMNQTSFTAFLKRLWEKYAPRTLVVICDNATYHGGEKVRRFLKQYIGIELVKQPKRAPHLNPIEKLWKEVKRNRTHNRYFETREELISAVRSGMCWFQKNKERVLSLMTKWAKVCEDAEGALAGKYDSSFIPAHHIEAYNQAIADNSAVPIPV